MTNSVDSTFERSVEERQGRPGERRNAEVIAERTVQEAIVMHLVRSVAISQ